MRIIRWSGWCAWQKIASRKNFNGYIHLKTIPGASQELLTEAGLYADRMSINLEMPTEAGLKLLAPEKSHEDVKMPLGFIQRHHCAFKDEKKGLIKNVPNLCLPGKVPKWLLVRRPKPIWKSCTAPMNTIKITLKASLLFWLYSN